jgi:oxygen-independent coproporphyrinogen-3 oxidase
MRGLELELEARRGELERRAEAGAGFDTLYLGGGTPSALGPGGLDRLLDWLERSFELGGPLLERSVELNPEHVDEELLAVLDAHGVDRVSLGVQSLSPPGLVQLGRAHDRPHALAAIELAHRAGLRCSADLIVGWPGQGPRELESELERLLATGLEHLSIYALTIEPDTPWPKLVERGIRELPDEELQADLLEAVEERMQAAGFRHYEIASYARPGAQAIHNAKYWRWVDVVGLGPSAASVRHTKAGLERRTNRRGLASWLAAAGGEPAVETLGRERAAAEGLWLALRRLDGLEVDALCARFGVERAWVEARVQRQLEIGNLEWCEGGARLRVAPGRWLWHDTIALDAIA